MYEQAKVTPASIRTACEAMISENSIVENFTLRNQKVCEIQRNGDNKQYMAICDPFEVIGRTFDERGESSGLLVRFFADRADESLVEVEVRQGELIADPRKVVATLRDKGLWVVARPKAVQKVGELLSLIRPENDIITATCPGWYDGVFVSPNGEVFGASDKSYRLSEAVQFADPEKSGDLKGWQDATRAAVESGNGDFLCMGLISGIAGPLVNLMQEPTSVLINFAGTTSRGKTTAQRLGASVWGNPIRGAALVKFNVTMNAIEAIAERANGTLLAIDEGGQSGMTGAQYQTAVFNLAEGSGKHRLTTSASERRVRRWSTCITISEEIGFADKVRRDGRNAAAGAVARTWEIDVDDAETLDEETVEAIEGVKKHYGYAAPVYIQHLIDEGYAEDVDRLRVRVKAVEASLSASGDAPQKRRVTGAAAILLVAGELAQEAGLMPADYDLGSAVRRVLKRSSTRMERHMDPIETALANLRETVPGRVGYDIRELDYNDEIVHREVVAYFGYSDGPSKFTSVKEGQTDAERVYFISVEKLAALGGGNVTAAAIARGLNKQGCLLTPDKKNSLWNTLPRGQKIQHYRVSGTFFHTTDLEEIVEAA